MPIIRTDLEIVKCCLGDCSALSASRALSIILNAVRMLLVLRATRRPANKMYAANSTVAVAPAYEAVKCFICDSVFSLAGFNMPKLCVPSAASKRFVLYGMDYGRIARARTRLSDRLQRAFELIFERIRKDIDARTSLAATALTQEQEALFTTNLEVAERYEALCGRWVGKHVQFYEHLGNAPVRRLAGKVFELAVWEPVIDRNKGDPWLRIEGLRIGCGVDYACMYNLVRFDDAEIIQA